MRLTEIIKFRERLFLWVIPKVISIFWCAGGVVFQEIIQYWDASLRDGDLSAIRPSPNSVLYCGSEDPNEDEVISSLRHGNISSELVEILKSEAVRIHGNDFVDVIFSPFQLARRSKNGSFGEHGNEVVLPLLIPGRVFLKNRSLFPHKESWIARDLLEPVAWGRLVIGALDDFDTAKSRLTSLLGETWEDHVRRAAACFEQVTGARPDNFIAPEGWEKLGPVVVLASKMGGASKKLQGLANTLKGQDIASLRGTALTALVEGGAARAVRYEHGLDPKARHYGQMKADFPLGDMQREALTHHVETGNGELLAVNGPPGTGKTTLLQSVIAHEMVDRAIRGDEPLLVFASSSNNQAVTNIIDAFGEAGNGEGYSGRWLPDLHSFGLYFPAGSKASDERLKKYHCASFYGDHPFPEQMHTQEYLQSAKSYFLDAFGHAFGERPDEIIEACDKLLAHVKQLVARIDSIRACAYRYEQVASFLNGGELEKAQEEIKETERTAEVRADAFRNQAKAESVALERAKSELAFIEDICVVAGVLIDDTFLARLMRLIPGRRAKVWNSIKKHVRAQNLEAFNVELFGQLPPPTSVELRTFLERAHTNAREEYNAKSTASEKALRDAERVASEAKSQVEAIREKLERARTQHRELVQHVDWLLGQPGGSKAFFRDAGNVEQILLDPVRRVEQLLDVKLRYDAFMTSVHYWEARFLIDLEQVRQHKYPDLYVSGSWKQSRRKTLRRMAMLTPCMVSTLYKLPDCLKYKDREMTEDGHLIGEVDLLIIDEAGQVSPEVGGLPFALAKKALVVGDVWQIEPIYSVSRSIDVGNMRAYGLDISTPLGQSVMDRGLCVSDGGRGEGGGSIMWAAQYGTAFSREEHPSQPRSRGLFLNEHRRCPATIINVSNKLVYGAKDQPLLPMKPDATVNGGFPLLGWAHVQGRLMARGGSKANPDEAKAIAGWLRDSRATIESDYRENAQFTPAEQLVAIVTPFAAQVDALRKELKKHGFKTSGAGAMTVGSVHSLQGSERQIVIFSPTVTTQDGGLAFFDRGPNMLNVTVSRAKSSFLVFGDMGRFETQGSGRKPSSVLARSLFAHCRNELTGVDVCPRLADVPSEQVTQVLPLQDAVQHDEFMNRVVRSATDVLIVSPYVSERGVNTSGILESLGTRRDPSKVAVAYCPSLNEGASGKAAVQALEAAGATIWSLARVHAKTLLADQQFYVEGSFNWLSAVRDQSSDYHRHERSVALSGPFAEQEIDRAWADVKGKLMSLSSADDRKIA